MVAPGAESEPSRPWSFNGAGRGEPDTQPNPARSEPQRQRRRYGPRTCRICLDTVEPMFPEATDGMLGALGSLASSGRPVYKSPDPELGRLLSPCHCKGSQRYVHEGCLEAWRKASPNQSNYWQCSVCKFRYKISRLSWSSYLRSTLVKLAITLAVFLMLIFALGFVADPILGLWVDPFGTVVDTMTGIISDLEALKTTAPQEPVSWMEHWLKGFFTFGILGFVKVLAGLSPFHWWNLRSGTASGLGRRQAQGGGRARVENINIGFVIVGAVTFLVAIWKALGKLSSRMMDKIADNVLDIGEGDDEEEEEDFPRVPSD